jgi:hypothetical protein
MLRPIPAKRQTMLKWHRMKPIARRLEQELVTVYNWKNRVHNPLPTELRAEGIMVEEQRLLDWLAENEPHLVVIWHANKGKSDEQLKTTASLSKQDLFLRAVSLAAKGKVA